MELSTSEKIINLLQGQVYVKTWTPKSLKQDEPILLLHDSLGCTDMWRDFPEKLLLATGRQVISYDRLGFGRSEIQKTPVTLNFIQDEGEIYLPQILEALSIKNFYLFGHSVGGGMSLCAASFLGARCKGVITESAQALVEDRTLQGIRSAEEGFKKPEVFAKLAKYHGGKTQWVLDAWIKTWLSEDFKNWSLQSVLPKVTSPLLIIHGDRDEYGSAAFPNMIEELSAGPSEKHLLEGMGHVPHREKPELILNLVSEFIEAQSE